MKKLTLTLAGLALAGAALAQATGSGFTANPSAMPATLVGAKYEDHIR